MLRRTFLLAAVFGLLTAGAVRADSRPLVVVELYTSQGCSSCPPADALLGRLTERRDVLPLSLHVDYWDYIGWKDVFAMPDNGTRQRRYSRRFQLRYVYTPQMVVQGQFQVTGSDAGEVANGIARAARIPMPAVEVVRGEGGLRLRLPETGLDGDAELLVVAYDKARPVEIRRGENSGRKIVYHNVVRHLARFGRWRGGAREVAVPWNKTWGEAGAVIVQAADNGPILCAVRLPN